MKVVHVLKPSRRRKRSTRKHFLKYYSTPFVLKKELQGGFLPALIPIIAAAIGAAPAIAGTVIAAQNAKAFLN
ncbi:pX [Bovine adenovirus 6]|uniref:PX n=1 Tax=Bovine adenovirus 6 TaxID=111167 RepID=K9MNU6_9ADEN|nr:pX [Bovine adenovirus 6]AFV70640.1 pX [Bovine adenovirus 6]